MAPVELKAPEVCTATKTQPAHGEGERRVQVGPCNGAGRGAGSRGPWGIWSWDPLPSLTRDSPHCVGGCHVS